MNRASVAVASASGCEPIVVSGAAVSTVQRDVAASPVLPVSSVARTEKVYSPSARLVRSNGDVHALNDTLSVEHSNVACASPEKTKRPSFELVAAEGCSSMTTSGAIVSTVQLKVAEPLFPASSVSRTAKVWTPFSGVATFSGGWQV